MGHLRHIGLTVVALLTVIFSGSWFRPPTYDPAKEAEVITHPTLHVNDMTPENVHAVCNKLGI